jgi:hypothetical protein
MLLLYNLVIFNKQHQSQKINKEIIMSFAPISRPREFFSQPLLRTTLPQDNRIDNVLLMNIARQDQQEFEQTLGEYPEILTIYGGYYGRSTVLINAVRYNNRDQLNRIIEICGRTLLEQSNLLGCTPVFYAADKAMLKNLISMNVNLNVLATADPTLYKIWAMKHEPTRLYSPFTALTVLEEHLKEMRPAATIKVLLTHGACIQNPTPLTHDSQNRFAIICSELSAEITSVSSQATTLDECGLPTELQEMVLEYAINKNNQENTALEFVMRDNVQKEKRAYAIDTTLNSLLPANRIIHLISDYEEAPAADAFTITPSFA